jgi:hypothetical protein
MSPTDAEPPPDDVYRVGGFGESHGRPTSDPVAASNGSLNDDSYRLRRRRYPTILSADLPRLRQLRGFAPEPRTCYHKLRHQESRRPARGRPARINAGEGFR